MEVEGPRKFTACWSFLTANSLMIKTHFQRCLCQRTPILSDFCWSGGTISTTITARTIYVSRVFSEKYFYFSPPPLALSVWCAVTDNGVMNHGGVTMEMLWWTRELQSSSISWQYLYNDTAAGEILKIIPCSTPTIIYIVFFIKGVIRWGGCMQETE